MPRSLITEQEGPPAQGPRKTPGPGQSTNSAQAARSDLVGLATAGLAASLALVTAPSSGGGWVAWVLWALGLGFLALGLVRRSPWLLLFFFPVLALSGLGVPSLKTWVHPTLQAHPEWTAAALAAYLGAALVYCNQRTNAPMLGSAPLITGLAGLVLLAPALVAGAALVNTQGFLATYGREAARAQALGMTAGLAGLVAVFGLSVYSPMKAHSEARRKWARRRLVVLRHWKREIALLLVEITLGVALATLAWVVKR